MDCNCSKIIVLKPEYARFMKSTFMSKTIHLGKLDKSEYPFYAQIFPDAFEEVVDCKCEKKEVSVARKQALDYMKNLFNKN